MQKYLTTKKKQMYNDDLMPICICGVNHPITHYPLTVTPPEILGPAIQFKLNAMNFEANRVQARCFFFCRF